MSEWYYTSAGKKVGPVPEETLRMNIQTGAVSPDDLVWASGMDDWAPVGTVPQFAQDIGAQSAPGAPAQAYPMTGPTTHLPPNSAVKALVLGIVGLACGCFIVSIIAWSVGNTQLREMDAGRIDPRGRKMAHAGRTCGRVGIILGIAWIVFYALYFMVIIASLS